MTATRRRSASHWGAFTAEVRDGRLVGVTPFERDPGPSDLITSMPDVVHSPVRVTEPMVRQGWLERGPASKGARGSEPFVPVSWERALDLVSRELQRVKDQHGNRAIFGGSYGWSSAGRFHHARTQLHRFLHGFGGCVAQVTNYSYASALILLPHIIGTIAAVQGPVTDWRSITRHTKLMVTFGGLSLKNGRVTSGGAGAHGYEPWMRRAREAGVDFVNIGPVRADAADFLQAAWLPARPNTDAAFMLGLAHTLYTEKRHDEAFLARYCVGFERFVPYLTGAADGQPKDADWAARITGIDAETIRALARRMATERTMLTAAWSIQRSDHGEQPYWLLIVLAAMLGQIGLPGGGFAFGYGSINGMGTPRQELPTPAMAAGSNPIGIAIPVARVADLLLERGSTYAFNGKTHTYPEIKLVYWAGGNPFHHHQDLNRLVRAFQQPDTVIVNEPWWTATARHADIVLPATTTVERNDLGSSSRDRFVLAMQQAIPPLGQARNDFDIFAGLADKLGFKDTFTEGRDEMGWVRHLYDRTRAEILARNIEMPDFDTFWDEGFVEFREPTDDFVMFADFRADPVAHKLRTKSGKIEIFCAAIDAMGYDDCPGHPVWLEPAEWLGGAGAKRHPLHLVSNQPSTRLHGQLDPGRVSRASKIQDREPCWLHPDDAASRGINDGDVIELFNDRGRCLAGAVITDRVMPGCVQLAAGAWFDPEQPGVPGSLDKHGNPNVLTYDRGTSRLGQGPSALTALVEVKKFLGVPPPVTAFEPPPIVRKETVDA